jgi:serine/threonine protein phosphatase 1
MNPLFKPKTNLQIENLPLPKGRIIAIGDVHGCYQELLDLLDKLQIVSSDTVIFLGDLIDRGPFSEKVVNLVNNLDKVCTRYSVLGNHDEKSIRYYYHVLRQNDDFKYKIPMRVPEAYPQLTEPSLTFLAQMPHAIFIDDVIPLCFVHAGLTPSGFKQEPKAFIRNRYFIQNESRHSITPVKSIEIEGTWYVPEGAIYWTHFWTGKWKVLHGHSVNPTPTIENNCIGIDTGCCFGGTLTAWVRNVNQEEFFVNVKPA